MVEDRETYVRWLANGLQRGQETTRRADRWLRSWGAWLEEHGIDPAEVTADDAASFLGDLRSSGRYQASTLAQVVSCLRGYYAWRCQRERSAFNPWAAVRRPHVTEKVPRVLTQEQVMRLLAAPKLPTRRDARDRAVLFVMYATGARCEEICRIRLRDVDLDGGRVILHGKGDKERLAFLTSGTVAAIRAYLRWLPRTQGHADGRSGASAAGGCASTSPSATGFPMWSARACATTRRVSAGRRARSAGLRR